MRAIHKYEISVGSNAIDMPCHRQILSVASQPGELHDKLVMWAAVDTEAPLAEVQVFVVATGQAIDWLFLPRTDGRIWEFVGTAQAEARAHAWHVFQLKRA